VICLVLLVTVAASVHRVRRHPEERAHAGAPHRPRREAREEESRPAKGA
jgi:hypothetical protein